MLEENFSSSSGASCSFTLFNLQGARPSQAGIALYHIFFSLSSTFFSFFGTFQSRNLSQHSHSAVRRYRSELLYDTMFALLCQALFSSFRQPSGANKTMCSFAQPLSRRELDYTTTLFYSCQHFFRFSSLYFYSVHLSAVGGRFCFLAVAEKLFHYYNVRSIRRGHTSDYFAG